MAATMGVVVVYRLLIGQLSAVLTEIVSAS